MFRKKAKDDQTELELLRIRVRNLEKHVAELKKAPQVQAEEPRSFLDLESNQRIADFVKKSILEDIKNGAQTIPEKTKFSPL